MVNGKLVYALTGPAFHVEYYVDLPRGGDQRSIAYSFESPYAIRDFEASVQQPARATAFSVSPQPAQSVQGSDNFTYFLIPRNNVAAGEKVAFTIRYSKSDQGLSVAQTNVTAAQPAAAPPQQARPIRCAAFCPTS